MRRWTLILILCGSAAATGLAVAAKVRRDAARNTLVAMVAAEENGTYTAEVRVRERREGQEREHRFRVVRAGGRTSIDSVGEPKERRGGTDHRRRGGGPMMGPSRSRVPITDVDLVLQNYHVAVEGDESVAGRAARRIAVRPKFPGRPSCTLWIDRERSLLLKYETQDRTVETLSLSFEAKAPERKGWSRSHERREVSLADLPGAVGFPVAVPTWLPKGFRFHRATVSRRESVESLQLLYTDGLAVVSVLENPEGSEWGRSWNWLKRKDDACRAGRISREGRTMLTVSLEGVVVTVAGSIPEKELVDLLGSMELRRKP
ncbi:MAG: hypothetical protein HYY17_15605 [Planctomycetes bacterium]|nr:hypothetical protein [Planctomycetota bacterium]